MDVKSTRLNAHRTCMKLITVDYSGIFMQLIIGIVEEIKKFSFYTSLWELAEKIQFV